MLDANTCGLLCPQVASYIQRASWIRKMFEAGAVLKAQYGADKVFDFSLGNPDLAPPPIIKDILLELAQDADKPMAFAYMPNTGHAWVREALASHASKEQGVSVGAEDIVVACGAAGAVNCLLRAVLEPGEQVLSPAPFFVEYGFYTENHGGEFKTVPSRAPEFSLDLEAFEAAVGPKTRVVLINSPNNPTGAVYSRDELQALAAMLLRRSEEYGRPIYLVADEPYRFLAFDGVEVPSVLPLYEFSVVVSSFSKNLCLPGERVGYALVNPVMPNKAELLAGLALTNRILGYVNAPTIGQTLAARALERNVDMGPILRAYAARREAMAQVLSEAGYGFATPRGAFYFFVEAPGRDDVAFVGRLKDERILAVPGTGFGFPGYFRLAFCVGQEVIRGAQDGFARARADARLR